MSAQALLALAKAGYEGYADATGGKTFDGRDMPAWDDLPDRTVQAWVSAAAAIERASNAPAPPRQVTVQFVGGPWDTKTTDIDHVVAPVFAVGHEIGNHYWLDTKSSPPTYHWDGAAWVTP